MARTRTTKNPKLTHVDASGKARMVDVGGKDVTERTAVAEGFVRISPELEQVFRAGGTKKGPMCEVARLAGIQAAKRTDELVPLCHSVGLDAADVEVQVDRGRVRVQATVRTRARTGVEMEALTAVAVACLTVIDMGKAIDKGMVIEGVRVLEKRGGRSGNYIAGKDR